MSLHADESVQLVWAIANTEANLSGEAEIRPEHLFLGVLKVIDAKFPQQLQDVELPAEAHKQLANLSKQVQQYLEMTADDIKQLRRSLRKSLRGNAPQNVKIHMLHRSDASRNVFEAAAEKVVRAGGTTVTAAHLAEALFETGHINLDNFRKARAGSDSKGAHWEIARGDINKGRQRFADWFGRNLSRLASEGALQPFVGRRNELRTIARVLSRTGKRHVAIVGGPGVGKTALVEGLAAALSSESAPEALKKHEILELHGSDIAAGCDSEGELSKRISRLFVLVERQAKAVLFLDDFHGLFPGHLKPEATLALLTKVLGDDKTPCLVATTTEQWERLSAQGPSLSRHFHVIRLEEPPASECRDLAEAWAKHISAVQKVAFTADVVAEILRVASQLPKDRAAPDRIVDLLENAATFVKVSALSSRVRPGEVTVEDIQSVLVEHYGIRPNRAPRSVSDPT